MPDDELQTGQPVEQPADDQAQAVQRRFRVPSPTRDGEQISRVAGQAGAVRIHDRPWRRCGVKIQRTTQLLRGFPHGRESRVVHESALHRAVQHGTHEAEFAHAALQLLCGGVRVAHGQRREPGVVIRMGLHGRVQLVIHVAQDGCFIRHLEVLNADCGQ